ncbi:MAG: pilus assembly PilX N-terminal domain-containing protein [Psychromonas sp.]
MKKQGVIMKQEKGFVLVSVLIITTVTTMLAFSQIKENSLQERIGGNQQKEINARLAAEKGIIEAFEYIKEENGKGTSNTVIETALNSAPYTNAVGTTLQAIELDSLNSVFSFESKGMNFGAEAYLDTKIHTIEETHAFDDAVIACEGITLAGSAKIDSYEGGEYDDGATPRTEGSVKVVDGGVTVGNGAGNGITKGIHGTVTAYSITGNHDLLVGGEPVTGYIGEPGECDPLEIADNMPTYTGTPLSFTAGTSSNFDGVSSVGGVSPIALDVLGETKQVYVFDDFSSDTNGNTINISGDVTLYIKGDMDTKQTAFTLADNSSLTIFIDGKMQIDTNSGVFVDKSVSNSDGKVPLTVYSSYGATPTETTSSPETSLPPDTTTVKVEEHNNEEVTSTTTVITTETTITTSTQVTTIKHKGQHNEQITIGVPYEVVVMITDTTDTTEDTTDLAVTLSGNAQIYMNLYAPHGNVAYNGTGDIMGALRGKNVDISGTGGIHYDEGLAGLGKLTTAAATSLNSVYYSYH